MEKLTPHVFRALWVGPFWLNSFLLTSQIWAYQIFLNILILKYKIIVGLFYVKNCYGQKLA